MSTALAALDPVSGETVPVDFEVTVAFLGDAQQFNADSQAMLERVMTTARDAAMAVLNGESKLVSPGLATAIAKFLRDAEQLTIVKASVVSGGAVHAALPCAVEAFNTSLANLKASFEKEFPNAG